MSSYLEITSGAQLQSLLEGDKLTMIAFHRNPHEVLDMMGGIAGRLSKVRLARCDLRKNAWAESQYQITADPTFILFQSGAVVRRMSGLKELTTAIPDLLKTIEGGGGGDASSSAASGSGDGIWMGAPISQKNYGNIAHAIELTGLDIMNANTSLGGARVLFEDSKPSSKGADGVESDTDEQLMLYIPFQAAVKLHSIQITSLANSEDDGDDDDDEAPSRPRAVKLYCNTAHILGFEEAEEREATQTVELTADDWNKEGTAVINTKFVKFQNCSAITIFFVDVEREGGEKVRVDRIRLIGEVMHEKVDMAKLKQEQE